MVSESLLRHQKVREPLLEIMWHVILCDVLESLSIADMKGMEGVVRWANTIGKKRCVRAKILIKLADCLEEEVDLGYCNPSDTLGRDAAWEVWLSDKGVRNAMTKKTNMSPDKLVMQTHARTER